jgi:exodeoxyribonuclease V gamma subunit
LRSELDDAALIAKLAARFEPSSEPLPFELAIGDFTFSGALTGVTADGQFGFTPIRRSAYTLLDAWVRHLAVNALKPESAGLVTRWLTRDALLEFRPAEEAEIHLEALLRLYRQGFRGPLVFSSRTALAWIEAGRAAAAERWIGTRQRDGENMDPWFRLLFGELRTDLPEEMEELATRIFQPLFSHLTEISAGELARDVENTR